MSQDACARLEGWRFVLFNLALGLGHALVIFNAGAYIAMLPRVAGGLGIPPSYSTWTQTDYMTALAVGFPLGGWLARRIGPFRTVAPAYAGFALAALLCALARDLPLYLAGRILLGLCGGLTLPGGQALLLGEYSPQRKSVGIGVWSIVTLTPFSLGPPVGGWIADTLGWRWLFWLNIPVALFIATTLLILLYGRDTLRVRRVRFDTVGFALCTTVLFGLQTVLNLGNDRAWLQSGTVTALSLVTAGSLLLWVLQAGYARHPFIDLRLFADRNFAIATSVMTLGFLMFQGLLSLLIVQIQFQLGYSSWLAGLVFLPMAILAKPVASVMHEIVKRADPRFLASLSLLGFGICYFHLSRYSQADAFAHLFWPKLLEGACLGGFFVPLTTLMLHGLPVKRHAHALELANLLRIAAGAAGITVAGIVLYRRQPMHLTRYAEQHTVFEAPTEVALNLFQSLGLDETQAAAQFARLASRYSVIHAINDAFWMAGCGFLALAALVWLAKPTRLSAKSSDASDIRRETEAIIAEESA